MLFWNGGIYFSDNSRRIFLLRELLTSGTVCHHMLLTHVQLIVLRLTSINVGVVKMFIITINVILPKLETVVKVTNSLYSTVI